MHYTPAFRELPEVEIIDGARVRKMSPRRRHAMVQLTIGTILRRCAGDRGDVGSEWRCSLRAGATELVPDVAFVSAERLAALSSTQREEPPFAPDIAVEIRSPGDKLSVLQRKIQLYLDHGSLLVLDADPQERTINAHERGGAVAHFIVGERFRSVAVPWLAFEIAEAFIGID